MQHLGSDYEARRITIMEDLQDAQVDVESAMVVVNQAINAANSAIDVYNTVLQEANRFARVVSDDMETHCLGSTLTWINSPEGVRYIAWHSEWTCFDPDQLQYIAELNHPQMGHCAELHELPSEPDKND